MSAETPLALFQPRLNLILNPELAFAIKKLSDLNLSGLKIDFVPRSFEEAVAVFSVMHGQKVNLTEPPELALYLYKLCAQSRVLETFLAEEVDPAISVLESSGSEEEATKLKKFRSEVNEKIISSRQSDLHLVDTKEQTLIDFSSWIRTPGEIVPDDMHKFLDLDFETLRGIPCNKTLADIVALNIMMSGTPKEFAKLDPDFLYLARVWYSLFRFGVLDEANRQKCAPVIEYFSGELPKKMDTLWSDGLCGLDSSQVDSLFQVFCSLKDSYAYQVYEARFDWSKFKPTNAAVYDLVEILRQTDAKKMAEDSAARFASEAEKLKIEFSDQFKDGGHVYWQETAKSIGGQMKSINPDDSKTWPFCLVGSKGLELLFEKKQQAKEKLDEFVKTHFNFSVLFSRAHRHESVSSARKKEQDRFANAAKEMIHAASPQGLAEEQQKEKVRAEYLQLSNFFYEAQTAFRKAMTKSKNETARRLNLAKLINTAENNAKSFSNRANKLKTCTPVAPIFDLDGENYDCIILQAIFSQAAIPSQVLEKAESFMKLALAYGIKFPKKCFASETFSTAFVTHASLSAIFPQIMAIVDNCVQHSEVVEMLKKRLDTPEVFEISDIPRLKSTLSVLEGAERLGQDNRGMDRDGLWDRGTKKAKAKKMLGLDENAKSKLLEELSLSMKLHIQNAQLGRIKSVQPDSRALVYYPHQSLDCRYQANESAGTVTKISDVAGQIFCSFLNTENVDYNTDSDDSIAKMLATGWYQSVVYFGRVQDVFSVFRDYQKTMGKFQPLKMLVVSAPSDGLWTVEKAESPEIYSGLSVVSMDSSSDILREKIQQTLCSSGFEPFVPTSVLINTEDSSKKINIDDQDDQDEYEHVDQDDSAH